MTDRISGVLHAAFYRLRLLVPYVALAVVVPGGSVLAILLWLQVHRHIRM